MFKFNFDIEDSGDLEVDDVLALQQTSGAAPDIICRGEPIEQVSPSPFAEHSLDDLVSTSGLPLPICYHG